MAVWLKQAHIHWGLNSDHKSAVSEGVTDQDTYSWWWGIRRMLMGMLAPDTEMVISDLLTIPDVEGQSALTLGKLVQVIALLGQFANELTTPRTPAAWAKDLIELRDACFMPLNDQEQSWDLIAKVAADLAARCEEAEYEHTLSLRQVRDLLLNRFSSPDAGNHFMTGQVTVCSMLPMRSIPFKKVCILGLNDSEFPRKSTPLGLDLMAGPARRVGDRSRRLEDRYLFLEAIISCRDGLYLSYQGNDVKNNSERQPSLVLAEFLDMLQEGYTVDVARYVKHAPLHPFSESAFTGELPSYETGWLRLADALRQARQSQCNEQAGDTTDKSCNENDNTGPPLLSLKDDHEAQDERLSAMQVANAFKDPLAYFSIQRLGVNLQQSFTLLENSEPFETNALVRYHVLDAIFASPHGNGHSDANDSYSEQVIEFAAMRGDIPANPVAQEELEMWRDGATALTQAMGPHDAEAKSASFTGQHITFTASAFEGADSLMLLCAGKINDTRALCYFISQLVFCSSETTTSHSGYPLDVFYCDWEKGETNLVKRRFMAFEKDIAQQLLLFIERLYIAIYTAPTPLYRSAFDELVPGKRNSQSAALVKKIKPEHFIDIVEALLTQPDTVNNDVSESTASLINNVTSLFDDFDAERFLKNWLQSAGPFTSDIANNPYIKWLFPQGISWRDLPHTEGFILFAMVINAAVEEKL